jgi:sporulation protein YlmC with PRC-barrel domain
MFSNLRTLIDAPVITKDGDEKHVRNLLFDDQSWCIRFLVVEVGSWLARQLVVVQTDVVDPPDWAKQLMQTNLSTDELLKSPEVDAEKPVSRQQQLALNKHFGWPDHMSDWYTPPIATHREFPVDSHDDPHLRGALDLVGYEVWTTDGNLGVLEDYVLQPASWRIKYLMVRVGDWVFGRRQFVPVRSVKAISWAHHRVILDPRWKAA